MLTRIPNLEGGNDLEVLARTQECSDNSRHRICIEEVEVMFANHKLKTELITGQIQVRNTFSNLIFFKIIIYFRPYCTWIT